MPSFLDEGTELHTENNVQKILTEAKQVLQDSSNICFDPQGRVLFEVDKPEIKIVSLDISDDASLMTQYKDRLRSAIIRRFRENGDSNDQNADKILNLLDRLPSKTSIIPLQQEFYFHLALTLRLYESLYNSQPSEHFEENRKELFEKVMVSVNALVMDAFAEALINATDGVDLDSQDVELDISKVNKVLDGKRKSITPKAHTILLSAFKDSFTDKITSKTRFNKSQAIKIAKVTAATDVGVLHEDKHLHLVTSIEGSSVTSHTRKKGSVFAHRRIEYFRMHDGGLLSAVEQVQIRTPSLAVKTGLKDEEYIADVVVKLEQIRDNYQLSTPITYNLLTALNDRLDDINFVKPNYQTKSARHIILGAHRYNRNEFSKTSNAAPCLVQAISVNGYGSSLGYASLSGLQREATLLSEMALCHNCNQSASEDYLREYKEFLSSGYHNSKNIFSRLVGFFRSSAYFINSTHGQELRSRIESEKSTWRNVTLDEADDLDSKELVKAGLKKIMAFNLHFGHKYAKLTQSLSLFVEKASLVGCKSGNERTPIICEREQILLELPDDVKTAIIDLAKATDKKTAKNCADKLKLCIDRHYNEENLYGGPSLIPMIDTAAGHKIQTKEVGVTINRNYAEEMAITNLKQNHAGSMQSHKGLVDFMGSAISHMDQVSLVGVDSYSGGGSYGSMERVIGVSTEHGASDSSLSHSTINTQASKRYPITTIEEKPEEGKNGEDEDDEEEKIIEGP